MNAVSIATRNLLLMRNRIKNLSPQRRFAVRIEIELKDDSGKVLDPAKDYAATIEPGAVWNFKAMVNAKGATAARISAIKEEN